MTKRHYAIIGTGEVPMGNFPERTDWEMVYETSREAIEDAGLSKDDIQAVVAILPLAQPRFAAEVGFGKIPEELGLKGCKAVNVVSAGGASATNSLRMAGALIDGGLAQNVLIVTATKHSSIPLEDKIAYFAQAGTSMEWEYPFGMTYNGLMGIMTERYMYETGATPEEMASVCVAWRKWAQLDPNAMFRKPLTIEEVLESRMITTPLHMYECNVLADGGAALVVTSGERAKEITDNAAYHIAEAEDYCQASLSLRPDILMRTHMHEPMARVFAQTGLTVNDMDILQLYTAYPVWFLTMLEESGACERGKGGRFVLEGHTSPGGKMPCSTIGDATSKGHNGSGVGLAYYVETARQLMGKAGARQVPNCEYVLATSGGGSGMNWIAGIWGRDLP